MRTAEEILEEYGNGFYYTDTFVYHDESIIRAINEAQKESAIEFFKWYGIKITGLIEYIQDVRPRVRNEEVEAKIEEFEGQPLDKLYELFLKSNELK